jgi:hypothetical protein
MHCINATNLDGKSAARSGWICSLREVTGLTLSIPVADLAESHPSPLVIPTGAKRSGGICSAPCGSLPSFLGSVPDEPSPPGSTPVPNAFLDSPGISDGENRTSAAKAASCGELTARLKPCPSRIECSRRLFSSRKLFGLRRLFRFTQTLHASRAFVEVYFRKALQVDRSVNSNDSRGIFSMKG